MMAKDEPTSLSRSIRIDNDYPTRAVILAAGKGRRLEPLTATVPKPLLSVEGRPMLDTILRALNMAGVTDTCIVVNHLASQIVNYIADGRNWEMTIHITYQNRALGTADALNAAADFLIEPCFVLAADYALPAPFLVDLKRFYQSGSADIVVSLKNIPGDEVRHRSSVQIDESGNVMEILEKPSTYTRSDTIGASLIYIVPPEIKPYLRQAPLSRRGEYELPELVNLMIGTFTLKGLIQKAPQEWTGDKRNPPQGQG